MSESTSTAPLAITHPLLNDSDPAKAVVYDGDALLLTTLHPTEKSDGKGNIYYDVRQDCWPRIDWAGVVNAKTQPCLFMPAEGCEVLFEVGSATLQATGAGSTRLNMVGKDSSITRVLRPGTLGSSTGCTSVKFLVFNLEGLGGLPVRYSSGASWSGRNVFSLGEWTVTLDACEKVMRKNEAAPDYMGEARCSEPFSEAGFIEFERELLGFLALIQGSRSTVYAPALIDAGGNHIGTFLLGDSREMRKTCACFCWPNEPKHDIMGLADRFHAGWTEFRELLQTVLSWRSRCYRSPSDAMEQVVSGCIAIESLSYGTLVDAGVVSSHCFSNMPAGDAAAVSLSLAGQRTAIPSRLPTLESYGKGKRFGSGPETLFNVRNELVHPAKKSGKKGARPSHEAIVEAKYLVRFYLDKLVFHLIGAGEHLSDPFA